MQKVVSDFQLKAETSVVDGVLVSKLSASWEGKPEQLLEIYVQQLPKVEAFVGALFGYLANVKELAKKFEAKTDDTTQKPSDPTTPPQNGSGEVVS